MSFFLLLSIWLYTGAFQLNGKWVWHYCNVTLYTLLERLHSVPVKLKLNIYNRFFILPAVIPSLGSTGCTLSEVRSITKPKTLCSRIRVEPILTGTNWNCVTISLSSYPRRSVRPECYSWDLALKLSLLIKWKCFRQFTHMSPKPFLGDKESHSFYNLTV